jgi:alanine dehydrogenase
MSEIIGRVAINIISNFLMEKKGKLLGGIPGNKPSELLVIGAGAVAHSVIQSAIYQKASIKVFDNSVSRLRALESKVSSNIYSSVINMPQLLKEFSRADVVIGALPNYEEYNNFIIPEEYTKQMKKNSLIIDLSIDQGICFETSKLTNFKNPTFEKFGVTHYGIPNIPSIASRTSSKVLGNIYLQYFSSFQKHDHFNHFLKNDSNFQNGLYFYNGILVKEHIGKLFDIPTKDINLILAAF